MFEASIAKNLFLKFSEDVLRECLEVDSETIEQKSVQERLVLEQLQNKILSSTFFQMEGLACSNLIGLIKFSFRVWWYKSRLMEESAVIGNVCNRAASLEDGKTAYVQARSNPNDTCALVLYTLKQMEVMMRAIVILMKVRAHQLREKRVPDAAVRLALVLGNAPPLWVKGRTKLEKQDRDKLLAGLAGSRDNLPPQFVHPGWLSLQVPLLWVPYLEGDHDCEEYVAYYEKGAKSVSGSYRMLLIRLNSAYLKWINDVTLMQAKLLGCAVTVAVYLLKYSTHIE